MLNRKILHALGKVTMQMDHVPPLKILERVRKQHFQKDTLIDHYISMKSTKEQDYFPENISETAIQILLKQRILMARFIFASLKFKVQTSGEKYNFMRNSSNQVCQCAQRLKGEYLNRYLSDIGFLNKQNCELRPNHQFSLRNYQYYNSVQEGIKKIHSKRGDYQFLEDRHDYIQWMFPNHYRSAFNSHAEPMSYMEVQIFKSSRKFGLLMLQSIEIFLDFMGIELGEDYRMKIVSEHRLKQALLVNWHNHLRIRRLLACFSITGFRHIALELIQFLKHLVHSRQQYGRIKRVLTNEWQIYGDGNKQESLTKLCFHPHEDFPPPHFVCEQIFILPKIIAPTSGSMKDFDKQQVQQSNQVNSIDQQVFKLTTAATKSSQNKDISEAQMDLPMESTPIALQHTNMQKIDSQQKNQNKLAALEEAKPNISQRKSDI